MCLRCSSNCVNRPVQHFSRHVREPATQELIIYSKTHSGLMMCVRMRVGESQTIAVAEAEGASKKIKKTGHPSLTL